MLLILIPTLVLPSSSEAAIMNAAGSPRFDGKARRLGRTSGALELDAVVEIVSVIGTVVMDDVKAIVAGLKLQVVSEGRFEHIDGESVAEPVKPFCAVNVRVVDPDWPGFATVMLAGFAVMAKFDRPCVLKNSQVEDMVQDS